MKKRLSVLLSVFLLCGVLFPAAGSFAFIPANASKAAPGSAPGSDRPRLGLERMVE